MSEETKGTTATVQTESTEPESQTEPAQRAETLTAEAVSQMIAEAFQGFEQRQSEAKKLAEMTEQKRSGIPTSSSSKPCKSRWKRHRCRKLHEKCYPKKAFICRIL